MTLLVLALGLTVSVPAFAQEAKPTPSVADERFVSAELRQPVPK